MFCTLQSPSPAAAAASRAAASASSCISRALSTASLSISMAPDGFAAGSGRDGAAPPAARAAVAARMSPGVGSAGGPSTLALFGPGPGAPSHLASRFVAASPACIVCRGKWRLSSGSGIVFPNRGGL